eukprot:NODE_228_length_13820_cov_0.664893.p3 type:complete len:515 gc:universal NODE_228_length_13820_cov_0.664893:6408-4864(-)
MTSQMNVIQTTPKTSPNFMCQFQINGSEVTFIFPPQFGLLSANVNDFMESYNLAEKCVGCINKTISIRQLTNITLSVDEEPLCQLQISTSDFYYVLLAMFILCIILPLGFSLFKKVQIFKTYLIHFVLYFQLSLFILFSNNLLLQSNFNILFYYLIPFLPPLSLYFTALDSILNFTLNNYLLNILYSILLGYAIITILTLIFFALFKLFPIKQQQQGINWRNYIKIAMNQIFLLIGPFYLISMLPMSGVTILLVFVPNNDGILVFLFFYLFMPLSFLCYLCNKYNTFQIESWQINKSYFSLLFHSIHYYANKQFILLVVIQLLQGLLLGIGDTVRNSLLMFIEMIYLFVLFICSRHYDETNGSSLTIQQARQLLNLDYKYDGHIPRMFSIAKIILFALLLVNDCIPKTIKVATIAGFVTIGAFILCILALLLMMLKQSIPQELDEVIPRYETPPDSPIDRRASTRRLDWLQDEFEEQHALSNPEKILVRSENRHGKKVKQKPQLWIDTTVISKK